MQEGVGKRLEEPSIWKVLGLETENPVPDELNKEDSGDLGGAHTTITPKIKLTQADTPYSYCKSQGLPNQEFTVSETLPLPGSAHRAHSRSHEGADPSQT